MFEGLGILGLFVGAAKFIKESTEKEIPADYWNNKDLMRKDKLNPNISPKQFMKNLENGKYYAPYVIPEHIEQPVKPIVDRESYEHDVRVYGKEVADFNAKHGMYAFILKSK